MKHRIAVLGLCLCLSISVGSQADGFFEDLGRFLGGAIDSVFATTFQYLEAARIRLAVDYTHPVTNSFARSCVKREHAGNYNIAQICDIWDTCNSNWVYISDPYAHFDRFFSASETINANLRGDCDDFAVLLAACIRAIGGTAVIMRERTQGVGHAYTCVYIGSDIDTASVNLRYVLHRYSLPIETVDSMWLFKFNAHPEWGCWMSLDWHAPHPGSPRWTNLDDIVDSKYMPTPSVLGLLNEPILQTPDPEEVMGIVQRSME